MAFADENPNLDRLLTEFGDGAAGVKTALVDGRFEVSEIRDVLNRLDPALGQYVGDMLASLQGLYPEMKTLLDEAKRDPFKLMMNGVPYLANKLMAIFK